MALKVEPKVRKAVVEGKMVSEVEHEAEELERKPEAVCTGERGSLEMEQRGKGEAALYRTVGLDTSFLSFKIFSSFC